MVWSTLRFHQRLALSAIAIAGCLLIQNEVSASESKKKDLERGRYLVIQGGCNDCHTPGYGMQDGKVPEPDWLIGDSVGWRGPWGTTYPTNLRSRIASMSENDWVAFAKTLKTRPPMPWYTVNAMLDEDLRSMYRFVKSLGDHANQVPAALPPGAEPKTPYFTVVMPPKG